MSTATRDGASPAKAGGSARPEYELRAEGLAGGEMRLEVWELPTAATPRLTQAERVAGLEGRNLQYVEARVLRRLRQAGISLAGVRKGDLRDFRIEEDVALNLALLFRVLAPMRSGARIAAVADGVEKFGREEAGYWMGMAIHRRKPRRVLAALRILLTTA